MILKPGPTERARTVGHVSHASQVRVDRRVQDILARHVALDRARRAARHVNSAQEQGAHFAAQLVERLKWAGEDAEQAEREAAIREP